MKTPFALTAFCTGVLLLAGCDKTPPNVLPTPTVDAPLRGESGARAGPTVDPSLPTTGSAFPSGTANKADPTLATPDGTRKPAKESTGAPMPGQNNDHSAPLATAKGASSP